MNTPRPKLKTRIGNWAAMLSLAISAGFMFVVLYWSFYPYNVGEVRSPATVINKQVHLGEALLYEIEGCTYSETPVVLSRKLVNDFVFSLPSLHLNPLNTCFKEVVSTTVIPKEFFPGKYRLVMIATHKVNPIRYVTITWETEEFEIIE